MISAFNASVAEPLRSAQMLLRPKGETKDSSAGSTAGLAGVSGLASRPGTSAFSRHLIKKRACSASSSWPASPWRRSSSARRLPSSFLPDEDQGYIYVGLQLPNASSLQRTSDVARKVGGDHEEHLPGVKTYTSVVGFSLLSTVYNTLQRLLLRVNFKPWSERTKPDESYAAIKAHLTRELTKIPEARAFAFAPPSIPGVGTAGGFTFVLEDRAGKDVAFPRREHLGKFMTAARACKELTGLSTTFLPSGAAGLRQRGP